MNNSFIFSDDNKRYHTYNYFLRHRFGEKVFKVSLNASMTCPNRDGTKGTGGCFYCSESRSGDFGGNPADGIDVQFDTIRRKLHKKWSEASYIAYFQAGTNTFAPLERLKALYEEALRLPKIRGLSIATRADCIDEKIADYLSELSKRTFLTVELGLQTIHDETSKKLNRCH
ncbi:MAG: TIGR01212 family radical SAM protein, partial [Oscillospiraceae bacterium]